MGPAVHTLHYCIVDVMHSSFVKTDKHLLLLRLPPQLRKFPFCLTYLRIRSVPTPRLKLTCTLLQISLRYSLHLRIAGGQVHFSCRASRAFAEKNFVNFLGGLLTPEHLLRLLPYLRDVARPNTSVAFDYSPCKHLSILRASYTLQTHPRCLPISR